MGALRVVIYRVYLANGAARGCHDADAGGAVLVQFPEQSIALSYRDARAGLATTPGVELSGAVYHLSDGAGVKTRVVGPGDCGGGIHGSGASRHPQRGLDAAAGVYGDVH